MSLPLGGWKDRHKQLHNLPATPLFSCWPSVRHWKFKRRLIRVDAYHLNDLRGQITSGKCQLHLYSTCVTCGDVQERLAVMSVTDMLSMSESRLERQAVDCGATQNDTQRLVLAVSNLRHCIGWSFGLAYCKTSAVLWHCWLGDRKCIPPVKSWVLVCWWWRFDWIFARLVGPVVTTTSIILSFNKTG